MTSAAIDTGVTTSPPQLVEVCSPRSAGSRSSPV